MAPTMESQYKDLLNPVKDIEKSFNVDISELLSHFIRDLGSRTPNFNSAALLIQGSASLYGKKVEYLYTLATKLYQNVTKQQNELQDQNKKEAKEKQKKEKQDKFSDPFHSVDFKMGKNLSCLRRKNLPKVNSKKSSKKGSSSGIPVHLLSSDNDDKGDVFYDTRGEVVGNKGDFAINKCRLLSSGWLLLPTVNPALVPSLEAVPDYYDDPDNAGETEDAAEVDDFRDFQGSPEDEGFQSYPQSSDVPESIPESNMNSEVDNVSSQNNGSAVPSTDEGIGGTPADVDMVNSPGTSEGIENVPAENGDENAINSAPMPIRQRVRQALKTCQLAIEDDPLIGININKELLKRRKIEKKNVRCLPEKLKLPPGTPVVVDPISLYCARTFFDMTDKSLKNSLMDFDTKCFEQNSHFMKRMAEKLAALKNNNHNKNIDPIEDEREVNVDEIEVLKEANEDDETLNIPFDDNDIQIDHDPIVLDHPRPVRTPLEDDLGSDSVPAADMPSPDINHIGNAENDKYVAEVQNFIQNSDITRRVHEWEKSVKPFLDELEQRESFDINMYGSRILNAFDDNNRKQTMTFRQFCRNKEKWEVHRYFMALLPLANVGNVSIESEPKEDGTEEIFVTLLSRKMHHKELEEFGHNDGSHS